jgi:hypothetical protein
MAVTEEDYEKAELVVEESKKTVQVDTGALKRSIHVTVKKGGLVFRQYFYGIEDGNSKLVENAKKMMGETPYIIELVDEEGRVKDLISSSN